MATISFQRQLRQIITEFDGTLSTGYLTETSNSFYLPLTFSGYTAPTISVTGVTVPSSGSTLVGSAGAFDNIRVGDIVTSLSTGTLSTPSDVVVEGCFTPASLFYIVYPAGLNSTNLGVSAGDSVSGTGIAMGSVVEKIDYTSRRIFLTLAVTATGTNGITFSPPVRVTAVRPSTATANANQVDISVTCATAGSNSTVVFTNGALEAVHTVLKFTPVDNTTGSKVNMNVGVSYLTGSLAKGSPSGLNGIDFTTLNYVGFGTLGFDGDLFLINARIPRPTGV